MSVKIIEIDYLRDTAQYFQSISDLNNPVWLDSSADLELGGRFDIITAAPEKVIEARGDNITVLSSDLNKASYKGNAFEAVREQLDLLSMPTETSVAGIPFTGGALGYWGYGLGNKAGNSTTGMPDMRVGIYLWSVVVDRLKEKAWLCARSNCSNSLFDELQKRFCVAVNRADTHPRFAVSRFSARISEGEYRDSVFAIKDFIDAGDCYQVNYSQEFYAACEGNPFNAYIKLREEMPAHYSAFLGGPGDAILSLSPECFLTLSVDGKVTTKPIKGTAPRHSNIAIDALNATTLEKSEKDRAENIMIVDLMRNDLGKVCAGGSVAVEALCALESFANVHHLVSKITGELGEFEDALSLLESAFPAGSITGAPKLRSMEIIDELEAQPRSVYCGSIGYVGFDGSMDVNVAIRTLEVSDNKVFCRGGGGITSGSEVQSEFQESLDKVGPIMACLESSFGAATPKQKVTAE